jgi:2'-5' RNA ligase
MQLYFDQNTRNYFKINNLTGLSERVDMLGEPVKSFYLGVTGVMSFDNRNRRASLQNNPRMAALVKTNKSIEKVKRREMASVPRP